MSAKILRDLFGDPNGWTNQISDGLDWMPDMNEATIVDVFVSGNQVAIYTRSAEGIRALSVFCVDDQDLRVRAANALAPGANVHEAMAFPI